MTYESYVSGMQKLLDRYGIINFTPEEIATPEGGIPPRDSWLNAILTLIRLQRLRDELKSPLYINTPRLRLRGFRSPEANAAVKGASGSIHLLFNAFDVSSPAWVPRDLYNAMWDVFPEKDLDMMGIGRYRTFLHVDTRGYLGLKAPARWNA